MVLTNCNNDYLPLDTETAMQTNFYKNGNHQLNRQNASLNLLEFGAGNNNNVQHSSVLSSNGYYGFAAHHNVGQSVPAPGFLAQRSLQQQQASEATTDEEMSVDIEESGAAEKRKRFDEASWQPMETKRFRFASSCVEPVVDVEMPNSVPATANQPAKSFLAHRDSNRCMFSHMI